MYQQLQNWSQGLKSVDEYTEEFYLLLTQVDLSESDDQLVSQYIGGLQQQIQDSLNLFDPTNDLEAYQRVVLLEKTLMRGPLGLFGRGSSGSNNQSSCSFTALGTTQPTNQNKAPTIMGQSSRTRVVASPKCFRCGEPQNGRLPQGREVW
jgi:hypothetical protein